MKQMKNFKHPAFGGKIELRYQLRQRQTIEVEAGLTVSKPRRAGTRTGGRPCWFRGLKLDNGSWKIPNR